MYGERIRELRTEKNLTQKDLAEKLGTTQRTISTYEKEITEPNIKALFLMANLFQVSIDYLLGREDDYGNITTGTGEKLTLREEELLSYFRQMPDNIKNAVLETAKIMLDSVKEK